MAQVVIAVDVGGTTIAAGLVTPDGEVLEERRVPADPEARATLATLEALIDDLRARARDRVVRGIGVGVPGPVDAGRVASEVPHAPDLAERPLADLLRARFALPAYVDNDVNALALGEWRFGAARGVRSLVVLAPGTGFGCGIILDGRVVRGVNGYGGEFGHTPVKFDGPRCWCGGRGCLAIYASGRGIAEAARAAAAAGRSPRLLAAGGTDDGITAALVFRLAAEGDPVATTVVDDACRALGAMIATMVNGLNPEAIVITGGVAHSLLALEKRILAAAADYAFPRALAAARISIVPADKRTTMRGAAALVLYETASAER
ncbi:MAG TPA: ROK family protein [Methylomirabilota bacterium]|jgi:glucokinase|nr:ROK family protein [Methylomirabilota bacterium]